MLLAALGATMAVGAAACSTEETSTPDTAAPSSASSTTTTSASTTTAPETTAAPTTPPTTAPETTAAPTTTAAPGPTDASTFYLVGDGQGGWLFLGVWRGGEWVSSATDGGTSAGIDDGVAVRVSALTFPETEARTGETVEACFDGRTGPIIDVPVGPPEPPGFGYSAVAMPVVTDPAWPLRPRPVAPIEADIARYDAAGETALADIAVDSSLGEVEQTVVADLDGDGDEEALVAYEYVQQSIVGAPGDLAALLLIDTATGDSQLLEASAVGPDDGDDTTIELIQRFRVLDVVDLNGDARMEVLVHAWYYEGASVIAYEYVDGDLVEVMAAGCGA